MGVKGAKSLAPSGPGMDNPLIENFFKPKHLSSGCPLLVNFLGMRSGGRLPPAIPGEGIKEIKHSNRRTNVIRLLPNGFQERKLRRLADTSAKLFNEVNYERRQQFFRGEKVDLKGTYDAVSYTHLTLPTNREV